MKREVSLTSGIINLLVRRQNAGRIQYAISSIEVRGYTIVLMYANLSKSFNFPLYPYHIGQCLLSKISIDPKAHLRTWFKRSERLMGADPLNAG